MPKNPQLKLLFSSACDLSPSWVPWVPLPWLSLAGGLDCTTLLWVVFGHGAHGAFPNCWHALSSALYWSCLVESVLGRAASHLDLGCLDILPSCGYSASLCWALARQLVLVAQALGYSVKTSSDRKHDKAKVVYLPLCFWQREESLPLTGASTQGRLPRPSEHKDKVANRL